MLEVDGRCAATAYLHDSSYRRQELERSLVNPANGYSELRLDHYATGRSGDWDDLPEWNPPVSLVDDAELEGGVDAKAPLSPDAQALVISEAARGGSWNALQALGEQAFTHYPVQLLEGAGYGLSSRDAATRYGFWQDRGAGVGGIVRARMADGTSALAMTCSTCHAHPRAGDLSLGAPNFDFDLGRLIIDASAGGSAALALGAWGPGRLDVSSSSGLEPVKIADLRPTLYERSLQADGTVEQRNIVSLAIRIETLIITSENGALRPPREISLGLAVYLFGLSSSVPVREPLTDAEIRGEGLFGRICASCHEPPAYAGPPVALDVVGTDPTLGLSPDRGTGMYRVPSLRGVSTRGPLLHDGSLDGLGAMFDAARVSDGYSGGRLGPGRVQGHEFGLDWPASDRDALVAFLGTL